ncbi:MAG: transcriptional repressor [Hydrogenophilales bacterium]
MKRVNLTKHRKTIYKIILNSGEHLSADEIIAILRREALKISRATVFNSLKFLEKNNYLKSFSIFGSKKVYDPNLSDHHHIYDLDSNKLHDVSVDKFKKLSDIINFSDLKIQNKSIVKADVVFYVSSKS